MGTDPPEPIQYDPFDLDNSVLPKLFAGIHTETREAVTKLQSQNTAGAPLAVRDDVINKLKNIIDWMENFAQSLDKARTVGHRFQCMERDIREIKATTKETPPAASTTTATTTQATARAKRRELNETLRNQRELYEVTLTTPNNESKKTIADMHARQITKRCQDIIDTETAEKPKLNGINKITNGIRLQCKSPEDAKILRTTVNWNSAFDGLGVHRPKYGVVVHGVSVKELAALDNEDTKAATLKEWGEANGGIKLENIKPLRRKP